MNHNQSDPKKKVFILILASIFSITGLFAQTYELKGIVQDKNTGKALAGANILVYTENINRARATSSAEKGDFEIKNIQAGTYHLKVSYMGYKDFTTSLKINNEHYDSLTIKLESDKKSIEEVEVIGHIPLATLSGDTVVYNSDAYKTMPDANAEDMVEKLPGVIMNDGKVEAQGEEVKEVLVDGRPFFGNDPGAALKTLPAEVIEKIQIFDKQSDQSEFTGFDDGETTKVMNIITKVNMRNGQFGKFYGGYGQDDRYILNGNYNIFTGTRRITLVAQTNNINVQNFSSEDLLGVMASSMGGGRSGRGRPGGGGESPRPGGRSVGSSMNTSTSDFLVNQQAGITQTHSFGVNYSDLWKSKIDVNASYFFNLSNNNSNENIFREYLFEADSGKIYSELINAQSKNINHRFNLKLEYKINNNNTILFRPSVTLQQNSGFENFTGVTTRENILSDIQNLFDSDLSASNIKSTFLYRHAFEKPGRTMTLNVGSGYNDNKGDNSLYALSNYYSPLSSIETDQIQTLLSVGWNVSGNIFYTEPAGESGQIQLNYRSSYQYNESDKESWLPDNITLDYSIQDTLLTNTFNNNYLTQQTGIAYQFRKEKLMLMTKAYFQTASLVNQQSFPSEYEMDKPFNNLLGNIMLRYGQSRQNSLMLRYNAATKIPSITQLQEVVDNSNTSQISFGNTNLKQSTEQSLMMRYMNINDNSKVFFFMLRGEHENDYIATSTFIARTDTFLNNGSLVNRGTQVRIPVNLDGYTNLKAFITYGIPVYKLKTNLNLSLSASFTHKPGLVDGILNYSNTLSHSINIVASSNISEKVDFTLSSRSSLSKLTNSANPENDNQYFDQRSSAKFKCIFLRGMMFETNLSNQFYNGLSSDYNTSFWLWNAGIGKKLFKNQLGEIKLSVFDVLNQNQSIIRQVSDIYFEDSEKLVLQKYAMMTFTYNLRSFNAPEPGKFPGGGPGGRMGVGPGMGSGEGM